MRSKRFLWFSFTIICVIALLILTYFLYKNYLSRNTVFLPGNMQVKIIKIIRSLEAEKLVLSFSSKNPSPSSQEEYLLLKIVVKNQSPKLVFVPFTFYLLVENPKIGNEESRVYFKDDFDLPQDGDWKKLNRLERINPFESKEGTICFTIPKNAILKRFYVYQSYLTFP